jgi:hypothetical protein
MSIVQAVQVSAIAACIPLLLPFFSGQVLAQETASIECLDPNQTFSGYCISQLSMMSSCGPQITAKDPPDYSCYCNQDQYSLMIL